MNATHASLLLISSLLPGLLLGCQSAPTTSPRVAALVLSTPLSVPAERAAVEIQAGEVKDGGRIDDYRPYCRFELDRLADAARRIPPGRYPILRQYQAVPAAQAPQGLRYARLIAASGDPSYYVFATVYELAPNTAGLSRLTCQHWEVPVPNPPRHLNRDEIDSTLGAIARLE